MSEQPLPVTSPPRRSHDHTCLPQNFNVSSSESCKNSPNIGRKHESLAHSLIFKSGSQSAHNSPLPHRRLDKLEGVIRDKPSPLCARRFIDGDDCSSAEPSPPVPRKTNSLKACSCQRGSQNRNRETSTLVRCKTDCSSKSKCQDSSFDSPRRRVESDCSCLRRHHLSKSMKVDLQNECNSSVPNSMDKPNRRDVISSPARSIGEPGVFHSPIHRFEHNSIAVISSPAKSVIGEPGVFASPVRSICTSPSPTEETENIAEEDVEIQPKPDQTVVSGWLKFRDNKRWKIRWGVVTKLSPAADCLHLQLYRDSKDRYKQGQTKASLSLQQFLGIETGFTLDKESNTIAIICQDVIVVLAFDTRERLMQWQVKISNHLGEGIQYLVLVSSAPTKSKTQTGPARMHIQDHRFCLTTGVPPKLSGLWDIAYLRRYGVVDSRFCFEGGSRCGKGEGLYVFVTDQGEDITQALKLASQGRLSLKKRQMARKVPILDSPRRIMSPRPTEGEGDGYSCHIDDSSCTCGSRTPFWPSQESRDVDYGCGDTASVSECHDSFNDGEIFPKNPTANLERCMSCISKLGAPSMSRSSTATGNATPGGTQPPLWTILTEQNNQANFNCKPVSSGVDRMSICSSHGSSGGYVSSGGSEYSVPRISSTMTTTGSYADSCYESIPVITNCCARNHQSTAPMCQCHHQKHGTLKPPNRSPKPAMPLPITNPLREGSCITRQPIGAYENYDIPKTPIPVDDSIGSENYDKPKNIQEYLSEDLNKNPTNIVDSYGNYDTPTQTGNTCGCLVAQEMVTQKALETARNNCACNRVMSWADNWISLPYCRRGNGIENTGLHINKVKLSGEGKMPFVRPSGELAVYATVDLSKKTNRRLEEKPCDCSTDKDNDSNFSNYINLEPNHVPNEQKPEVKAKTENNTSALYINLDFAQSLENYENSKEVLQRAGISTQHFCEKCGHSSEKTEPKVLKQTQEKEPQSGYLTLDPEKIEGNDNFSGYLPMSPAAPATINVAPPLPSKSELLKRIMGEKSASNPSLAGPAVDRNRKRTEQNRVPGSAMMMLHRTGSSPYNRKQIMDNSDLLPADKRFAMRKRSSSADSSRFFEDCEEFDSSETLRKSSITETTSDRRSSSPCLHQETETCADNVSYTKRTETEDESSVTSTSQSQNSQSQSVHIRRSASVPCKAQNRDSSSSNDSGVSTGSLRHRVGDFQEFELPLTTALSARRHQRHIQPYSTCVHATLPRRSKSFDPLRDISFQFQKVELPGKSTSAEAEVPICPPKRGFASPCEAASLVGPPYVDSRSTSSGTSDMSDYIETLSLSSHGSSDAQENMRLLRQATSTLRPRSGKEYQNVDRSHLTLTQTGETAKIHGNPPSLRGLLSCSINYANITPVPENAESPSPGYQSGGSAQESQTESFGFKNELKTKQLSTGNKGSIYN